MFNCISLAGGHVAVGGLLLDIAGALVLGWAFSTKTPEMIRAEVPSTLSTTFGGADFPQDLAYSMVRQRSEARLGLALLVLGFTAQLAGPVFALGSLDTSAERFTVVPLTAALWALAYVFGWRIYVPWDERRTRRRMDHLEPVELISEDAS